MNPADFTTNLCVFFSVICIVVSTFHRCTVPVFYHIRDIKRLPLDLTKQIAVALVTGKLYYCSSLLHEIPAKVLQKLQRVQNCLARIVAKVPPFSRSIPMIHLIKTLASNQV